MNRKGSALLMVLIVVIVIALVGGGVWYAAHRQTGQAVTPTPAPVVVATSTNTPASLGFVYENYRFLGTDPFHDASFAVYDMTLGVSTTIKSFDAHFAKQGGAWKWQATDGLPLILSYTFTSGTASSQVEFYDPSADAVTSREISRSSIISPDTTVAASPAAEQISFCDLDGRFSVMNVAAGGIRHFDNAGACYVGGASQPPEFTREGTNIYYVTIPYTEQGYNLGSSTVPYRLNLADGTVASTSFLAMMPLSHRVSRDGQMFVDLQNTGFMIRQLPLGADDPTLDRPHGVNVFPVRHTLRLPGGVFMGDAIFTDDGAGVFYYTQDSAAPAGLTFALGYYDLKTEANQYPLPMPALSTHYITLLGALDKDHLVYQASAVPFSGNSSGGHIINSRGYSWLLLQGVSTKPVVVDVSVAGFSFKSFLTSK